jgi:hypothetical protein
MRWLLMISVAFAACSDGNAERMSKVKNAVCACKTSKCAELAMKDVPKDDVKPSHRSQELARDMLDCLAKLYDAERPSTDPDAAQ